MSYEDVKWKKVAGAIRSLVNARGLQFECVRVLHEELLMSVLKYGNKTGMERIGWTISEVS